MDSFTQYASSQQPTFGRRQTPFMPFSSGGNNMMGMAMSMFAPGVAAQYGMFPGQMNPTQSFYDQFRAQQYSQQLLKGQMSMGAADMPTLNSMVGGLETMAGFQLPAGARKQGVQDFGNMLPFMAPMAPGLFDDLAGSRGLATLMLPGIFEGGQYRRDPASGQYGLSSDSSSHITSFIHKRLYGDGANPSVMRGLKGGRAGAAYEQMVRRGMAPAGIRAMATSGQMETLKAGGTEATELASTLAQRGGLSEEDTSSFVSNIEQGNFQTATRDFDAARATKAVKDIAGPLSAVADMFADSGEFKPSIEMLFNGLNMLTQSNIQALDKDKAELAIRKTRELAKNLGVNNDALMKMNATLTPYMDRMGIDRSAVEDIKQGSMAYVQAFRESTGGVEMHGRVGLDKLMAQDQFLRTHGLKSDTGMQMGAMMRLFEEGKIKEGSEAESVARALEDSIGLTDEQRAHFQNEESWLQMMRQGGVGDEARQYRIQRDANQDAATRHELSGEIRGMQRDIDILPALTTSFEQALSGSQRGMGPKRRKRVAQEMANEYLSMSDEEFADVESREAAIAQHVGGDTHAAGLGIGFVEKQIKQRRMAESGANLRDLHSQQIADEAQAQEGRATFQAMMSRQLSHLNRSGPLSRFSNMLQEGDMGDRPISEVILESLGAVPGEDVMEAMGPALEKLDTMHEEFKGLDPSKREHARRARILERQMGVLIQGEEGSQGLGQMIEEAMPEPGEGKENPNEPSTAESRYQTMLDEYNAMEQAYGDDPAARAALLDPMEQNLRAMEQTHEAQATARSASTKSEEAAAAQAAAAELTGEGTTSVQAVSDKHMEGMATKGGDTETPGNGPDDPQGGGTMKITGTITIPGIGKGDFEGTGEPTPEEANGV